MNQARFASIVRKAGSPSVYLLWGDPQRDPGLQRPLKETRVMTLHLEARGAKAGYGHVGLPEKGERHELLVFPRSLQRFAGDRIVGIDYDLIDAAPTTGGGKAVRTKPKEPALARKVALAKAPSGEKAQRARPAPQEPEKKAPAEPPVLTAEKAAKVKPVPPPKTRPLDPVAERLLQGIRKALVDLEKDRPMAAYGRLKQLWAAEGGALPSD